MTTQPLLGLRVAISSLPVRCLPDGRAAQARSSPAVSSNSATGSLEHERAATLFEWAYQA